MGTPVVESGLSDAIFAAFEKKKDDSLTFEEYVNGLSIMCKGPIQRKLRGSFLVLYLLWSLLTESNTGYSGILHTGY